MDQWDYDVVFAIAALGYPMPEVVSREKCKVNASTCSASPGVVECSLKTFSIAARASALYLVSSTLGDLEGREPWKVPSKMVHSRDLGGFAALFYRVDHDEQFARSPAWKTELTRAADRNGVQPALLTYIANAASEVGRIAAAAMLTKYKQEGLGSPGPRCDDACQRQAVLALAPFFDSLKISLGYVLAHEGKHAAGCTFSHNLVENDRRQYERLVKVDNRLSCAAPLEPEFAADFCALNLVAILAPETDDRADLATHPQQESGVSLLEFWIRSNDTGLDRKASEKTARQIYGNQVQAKSGAALQAITASLLPTRAAKGNTTHLHALTRAVFFMKALYTRNPMAAHLCGEAAQLLVDDAKQSIRRCQSDAPDAEVAAIVKAVAGELLPLAANNALSQGHLPAESAYECPL